MPGRLRRTVEDHVLVPLREQPVDRGEESREGLVERERLVPSQGVDRLGDGPVAVLVRVAAQDQLQPDRPVGEGDAAGDVVERGQRHPQLPPSDVVGGPEGDFHPIKLAVKLPAEVLVVPPEGLDQEEPAFGFPGVQPGGEAKPPSGDQATVALAVVGAAAVSADDALVGVAHGVASRTTPTEAVPPANWPPPGP